MDHEAVVVAFYRSVDGKMVDLPVYNKQLSIDATAFRKWESYDIGVVVTPWCMNVLLLHTGSAESHAFEPGQTFYLQFPSGQYEFICAYDERLGDYATCSVFSPMFEFSEQAVALETATAVLSALFDEQHKSESERHQTRKVMAEQHRILEEQDAKQAKDTGESDSSVQPNELPEGLSRRAFLTGGLRRSEAEQS